MAVEVRKLPGDARLDTRGDSRGMSSGWVGEVHAPQSSSALIELPSNGAYVRGIEVPDVVAPASSISLTPGTTLAEIERRAIEAALRDAGIFALPIPALKRMPTIESR